MKNKILENQGDDFAEEIMIDGEILNPDEGEAEDAEDDQDG